MSTQADLQDTPETDCGIGEISPIAFPVSTIPLFKVQEAVRFAAARAGAREALRWATDLAGSDGELIAALWELSDSAERFGNVMMVFNRQAVGGAK